MKRHRMSNFGNLHSGKTPNVLSQMSKSASRVSFSQQVTQVFRITFSTHSFQEERGKSKLGGTRRTFRRLNSSVMLLDIEGR